MWVGANATQPAGAWETAANWHLNRLPMLLDTVKLFHLDGKGSNVIIRTPGQALCDKLVMNYGAANLTIDNNANFTTLGPVEMFSRSYVINSTSSTVDILAGGVWNACTLDSGSNFDLSTYTTNYAASKDTVNVRGTLNVHGTYNPRLNIGSLTIGEGGNVGSGTMNIYGGGLVFADQYTIGLGGVINMWAGSVFKIKGNVTSQAGNDIANDLIVPQDVGVTLTTYYNSSEDRTYVNPEPATIGLLGFGTLSLIWRWRKWPFDTTRSK